MTKKGKAPRWSHEDRRRFADGVRDRAQTVPPADKPMPTPEEWDDEWEELSS